MSVSWTIRQRLLTLLLATALPLLVALGVSSYASWQMNRLEAERTSLRTAQVAAVQVGQIIHQAGETLDLLSRRPLVLAADPAHCDPLLADIVGLHTTIINAVVANRAGVIVCAGRRSPGEPTDAPESRARFLEVMASGRRQLGPPHRGVLTGKWIVPLAQPLRNEHGDIVGVVDVGLGLVAMQRVIGASAGSGGRVTTIIHTDGTVIARSLQAERWIGVNIRDHANLAPILATPEGQVITMGLDGIERIYGFTPVPGTPWKIISGVPTAVAFGPLRAAVRAGMVALAITLLLAISAAVLLSRHIEQPVRLLAASIGQIGSGETGARVPVPRWPELARVATALNLVLDARDAAELERQRLQEKLRHGEAMATMGTLLATVAHEVRNPLFGITSTLDAFEARHGIREEDRKYVQVLRAESEQLSRLMADLLACGRAGVASEFPGPTPAREATEATMRLCEPAAARRHVHLRQQVTGEPPSLAIDHDGLVIALRNLVENAIEHAPADSEVVVDCHRVAHDGVDGTEWTVLDSGPGFAPGDLTWVFAPFHSRRPGGTGLGLAIVHRTAVDRGGSVVAENRAAGGAAVRMWLPASRTDRAGAADRSTPGPS